MLSFQLKAEMDDRAVNIRKESTIGLNLSDMIPVLFLQLSRLQICSLHVDMHLSSARACCTVTLMQHMSPLSLCGILS